MSNKIKEDLFICFLMIVLLATMVMFLFPTIRYARSNEALEKYENSLLMATKFQYDEALLDNHVFSIKKEGYLIVGVSVSGREKWVLHSRVAGKGIKIFPAKYSKLTKSEKDLIVNNSIVPGDFKNKL